MSAPKMTVRFIRCSTPEVRHKAYRKKDPSSTTGAEQNRVKITTVKDCQMVNVENEELDIDEENEALLGEDEEEKEEKEPTMAVLMESFRRYCEEEKAGM